MQEQKNGGTSSLGRPEHVVEAEVRSAHSRVAAGTCGVNAGSAPSMLARFGSSHGGSTRLSPRCAGSSSTPKPGPSVASSNSTPPGSLKYTDLNQNRSITGVGRAPADSTLPLISS